MTWELVGDVSPVYVLPKQKAYIGNSFQVIVHADRDTRPDICMCS